MTIIRCVVAGVSGCLAGGASGCALSFLFISTPLQQVLGPRASEFNLFGVIGVTVFAALIASVASIVGAAGSLDRLRSTFQTGNLLSLVLAPTLIALVLTFAVSGEWAWPGLIYLSTCLGILAGAGSALLVSGAATAKPDDCVDPSSESSGV